MLKLSTRCLPGGLSRPPEHHNAVCIYLYQRMPAAWPDSLPQRNIKKLLIAFEYYFQQHFTHSASLNESRSFGDALLTLIWAKVEKKKN